MRGAHPSFVKLPWPGPSQVALGLPGSIAWDQGSLGPRPRGGAPPGPGAPPRDPGLGVGGVRTENGGCIFDPKVRRIGGGIFEPNCGRVGVAGYACVCEGWECAV